MGDSCEIVGVIDVVVLQPPPPPPLLLNAAFVVKRFMNAADVGGTAGQPPLA